MCAAICATNLSDRDAGRDDGRARLGGFPHDDDALVQRC